MFAETYILAGVAVATLVFYHYWMSSTKFVRLGKQLPGPTPFPILGNALEGFITFLSPAAAVRYALRRAKEFPDIAAVWLGYKLLVFLYNPQDVEIILSSNTHIVKADEYKYFTPWLGDGLLVSKGQKWKTHRKVIAPTFHMNVLKSFVPAMNYKSDLVVQRLEEELGRTFDVHDHLSGITVDILLETVMGYKGQRPTKTTYGYAKAVMNLCDMIHRRQYKVWLRLNSIFQVTGMARHQENLIGIIHDLRDKVFATKKSENRAEIKAKDAADLIKFQDSVKAAKKVKSSEKNNVFSDGSAVRDDLDENDENDVGEKKRLPFLEHVIDSTNFTDEEIKEEIDTILFEGHDTTAAGSSFTLCLLGIHQDVQDKVMTELWEIFQDSNRPATFEDASQMKYLERVIMETLRVFPPVPIIAREVQEDVKLASGNYTIPAGSSVVITTYLLHKRESTFPNPDKFDPDNFLPDRCAERHYYSYVPFSAGPRSCVGRKYAMLKLKILISTILRNYRIYSPVTEKDFKLTADIILKRADGFQLQIEKRNLIKA